jgi:hypothetical protein
MHIWTAHREPTWFDLWIQYMELSFKLNVIICDSGLNIIPVFSLAVWNEPNIFYAPGKHRGVY